MNSPTSRLNNTKVLQLVNDSRDILHICEILRVDANDTRSPCITVIRSNFGGDAKLIIGSSLSNDRPHSIDFIGLTEDEPLVITLASVIS
jgi:hypothetical protein